MISIQSAILVAALSALATFAFTWGRASKDIEALLATVKTLNERMEKLILDVEKLKWHTGAHKTLNETEGG